MKKQLAFLLALALLGGCSAGGESSSDSAVSLLTGETVSGIITKVNGNEITLDLVTLGQERSRPEETEEAGERTETGKMTGEEPSAKEDREVQEEPGGARESRQGSGGDQENRGEGGSREDRGESQGAFPGGGDPPSGEMPSFGGGMGSGGAQKDYTRTGETALYQIPVGATVLTLTGTSRGFNSLSTGLLVTITFREDGMTPGQVQVIQSLS